MKAFTSIKCKGVLKYCQKAWVKVNSNVPLFYIWKKLVSKVELKLDCTKVLNQKYEFFEFYVTIPNYCCYSNESR